MQYVSLIQTVALVTLFFLCTQLALELEVSEKMQHKNLK